MRKLGKHVNDGCDKAGPSLWRGLLTLPQAYPETFPKFVASNDAHPDAARKLLSRSCSGKRHGAKNLTGSAVRRKGYSEYTLNGSMQVTRCSDALTTEACKANNIQSVRVGQTWEQATLQVPSIFYHLRADASFWSLYCIAIQCCCKHSRIAKYTFAGRVRSHLFPHFPAVGVPNAGTSF